MPEPASHGYVATTGAKALEAVGVTMIPGRDVTDCTVSWGQAGGGMYSTIADLGTWAGTGLGTCLLPADLAAKRLAAQQTPDGNYGLGIDDWG
jgi:D-alanyl-D-alanine carboxypeptidase